MNNIEFNELFKSKGVKIPQNVALLPYNFDDVLSSDNFQLSMLSKEIADEFRKNKIIVDNIYKHPDPCYREHRSADLLLPILCVGQAIANDPATFQTVLTIISNFLCEKIKALGKSDNVKMKLYRNSAKVELLEYEGPVAGLKEITKWKKR